MWTQTTSRWHIAEESYIQAHTIGFNLCDQKCLPFAAFFCLNNVNNQEKEFGLWLLYKRKWDPQYKWTPKSPCNNMGLLRTILSFDLQKGPWKDSGYNCSYKTLCWNLSISETNKFEPLCGVLSLSQRRWAPVTLGSYHECGSLRAGFSTGLGAKEQLLVQTMIWEMCFQILQNFHFSSKKKTTVSNLLELWIFCAEPTPLYAESKPGESRSRWPSENGSETVSEKPDPLQM